MRKIENEMNKTVNLFLYHSGDLTRTLGNTTISRDDNSGAVSVKLHNNLIATIRKISGGACVIKANSCGWLTVTTKSRLNSLLSEFRPGNSISQKRGAWFVRTPAGNVYPFYDGIDI